jgi:hypothetical protein
MRSILVSVLLLIVVLVMYSNLTEGDQGTKEQVERSGASMSDSIRRMSP